jgi:hypothetical protein
MVRPAPWRSSPACSQSPFRRRRRRRKESASGPAGLGFRGWTIAETTTRSPAGDRIIANVSDPTLTVFLPAPAAATGAAVVVAPGGALRILGWDNEGVRAAEWLNAKGVAAFVLKYRTLQTSPAQVPGGGGAAPAAGGGAAAPRQEMTIRNGNANPEPNDARLAEVLRMGIADAQQALRLVRRNATAWRSIPRGSASWDFRPGAASRSAPRSRKRGTRRPTSSCRCTARR